MTSLIHTSAPTWISHPNNSAVTFWRCCHPYVMHSSQGLGYSTFREACCFLLYVSTFYHDCGQFDHKCFQWILFSWLSLVSQLFNSLFILLAVKLAHLLVVKGIKKQSKSRSCSSKVLKGAFQVFFYHSKINVPLYNQKLIFSRMNKSLLYWWFLLRSIRFWLWQDYFHTFLISSRQETTSSLSLFTSTIYCDGQQLIPK